MTLVLTPENLGPVEVSVTLTKGTVDLTLRGAHDMGRAALLDGLPDLRRDLESAGLTCSRLEVDRDTGGSLAGPPLRAAGPAAGLRRPRRPADRRREPVTTLGRTCRYRSERADLDPQPIHVVRRGRAASEKE